VERIHSTRRPLVKLHAKSQHPPGMRESGVGKPVGLWYGIGPAWVDWCTDEMPAWIEPPMHHYRLTLDLTRVLRLRTADAIRQFGREYNAPPSWARGRITSTMFIDWPRVAQQWGGIEIAPYQWDCRLDDQTFWYYGWDVASGCVWDPTVVRSFVEVPDARRPSGRKFRTDAEV
jgi:hypothetical protein